MDLREQIAVEVHHAKPTHHGCGGCDRAGDAVWTNVVEPALAAKDAEIAALKAERDTFAMHLVNQIQHHKQRPGHEQLDRRACQNCAAFKALSEYPVIQAAHVELFRGLLEAIETGNYIACPAPEDALAQPGEQDQP